MTEEMSATGTDARSVELVWMETLQEELPVEVSERTARKYVSFLFADPRFVAGDLDPEGVVALARDQLDRYRPTEFVGAEDALDSEGWADLRETLVEYVREGVDGERRGPTSAYAGTADGVSAPGRARPETPTGPSSPGGPRSATPETNEGLASGMPDPKELTPMELRNRVVEIVEASEITPEQAIIALEAAIDELDAAESNPDSHQ